MSQPFGYDGPTLDGILIDARRCNDRDEITGALVCRHDVYLQLLEGPTEAVNAAFARISRDDRHADIKMLVNQPVTSRLFGNWAMLHDPATSWVWTQQEIDDGVLARASEAEVVAMFAGVAEKAKSQTAD